MKVTALILGSLAALAAAHGPDDVEDAVAPPPPGTGGIKPPPPPASTGAPLAGEPGGAPVVAVSPAGPGPNPNAPVPPNPSPYAGASVPVVGQAPVKCAVQCAITGLSNNKCNALSSAPFPVAPLPKGSAVPAGAVSRSLYEAVLELTDAQLPAPPPQGSSLISFSDEVRTCLCTGRNGRKLRAGGAKCKSVGGPQCSIRDSPIPPKQLVGTFLNQLCAGVQGWVPIGSRPKAPKAPKGLRPSPKGLGYPSTLSGGQAPAPGTPGGAPIVAVSPSGAAPGTPGGAPIVATSPAGAGPAAPALSPAAVPVAPGSGAAVPPSPAAVGPPPATGATTAA